MPSSWVCPADSLRKSSNNANSKTKEPQGTHLGGSFVLLHIYNGNPISTHIDSVYFSHLSSQLKKVRCQSIPFCGFSTQWFSSENTRNSAGMPLYKAALYAAIA